MNIRDWLEKNKIFFEIISPIVIAIAIIMVSIQANKILLRQAELMKLEQLPILRIDITCTYPPKGSYPVEKLTISNIGASLQEFDYQDMTFLEADGTKLVLEGCYVILNKTNNLKSGLATFRLYSDEVWRVISAFWALAQAKRLAIGYCVMKEYMRVKYKDILGEKHDEVYIVRTRSTSRGSRTTVSCSKLPDLIGKEIIKDYEKMRTQGLYLTYGALSPELLYKKFAQIND